MNGWDYSDRTSCSRRIEQTELLVDLGWINGFVPLIKIV